MSIEASDIRVRLGGAEVLRGVTIALRAGEVHAVLGPNGSGKSTLLRCLAGLLRPRAGRVTLDGRALLAVARRERARRVAFMPQRPDPPPGLCVRELVEFGRFCHRGRRGGRCAAGAHAAAVGAAMDRCGVGALAERPTAELSGGELQRVFLAMALAQEPGVLLLDEPVSALDVGHQLDALELLGSLARERPLAAAVVLHDLNLAARFADRITLLHNGTVVASGEPRHALSGEHLQRAFGVRAHTGEPGAMWFERVRGQADGAAG